MTASGAQGSESAADVARVLADPGLGLGDSDTLSTLAEEAISGGASTIELDCGAISFMDSRGFGSLIQFRNALCEKGTVLKLINIPRQMEMLLEITGTADLLKAGG
ncbi:anti-sigma factor antagonist [Synechococcus sp. RSCCF101]|uniref:STAS domain-containing protein n=1 Tax=Synechococcus sp. RSCCF101 TaxID=2511069 RepID=UPI00124518C8|nr:STAS domain-containing protein [Synechococcus sp. RSCCF101]QEY31483.1 anti-sigma factor antagonist [Synechococcus sp. RSCCF101]